MSQLIANAQSIRARLRRPPNAVPDVEIDLKRLPRGFEFTERKAPQTIQIAITQETLSVPIRRPIISPPIILTWPGQPIQKQISRFIVKKIIEHVAKVYNVLPEEITGSCRLQTLVKPRHVAMYLARTITQQSLPWLGRHFGGKDHVSVLHAVRKTQARVISDSAFAADIAALECSIRKLIP